MTTTLQYCKDEHYLPCMKRQKLSHNVGPISGVTKRFKNETMISSSNIHYQDLQEKGCLNFFNVHDTNYPSQPMNPSFSCNFLYNQEIVLPELKLKAASIYLPKDDEKRPRGDDANFICAARNTIGVADGVGGWIKEGVDAGEYSRELMANSMITILDNNDNVDPRNLLEKAYSMTKAEGSSTACIITLCGNSLKAENVGDSGFLVVRDGKVLFKSEIQQRGFNVPYQLGNCRDDPSVAQEFEVCVQEGDIVVAGTDGLFDNMHDSEILEVLSWEVENGVGVEEEKACRLANVVLYNSFDRYAETPYALEARKAGRIRKHKGGKIDDITVVVACISHFSSV